MCNNYKQTYNTCIYKQIIYTDIEDMHNYCKIMKTLKLFIYIRKLCVRILAAV